jgi:hypothetical protein
MTCPNCGSTNVTVTMVQDSGRTRKRGCLWGIGRAFLIICTCGLWLLIGKSKSKTNFQHHKEAICQSCGNSWRV